MDSIAGQTVSHYALLEKLGAGGMGEIYKARDLRLNRIVAIKVLAPALTRDPERRRRFVQEAQAASALNHPNIVTVHDVLLESDSRYIVMEYVAGQTLQQLIAQGRMPISQVLHISLQMANALTAAHAAGIVHRDLKPANVMLTSSGLVKILDFGLAKLTDRQLGLPSPGAMPGAHFTLTAAPLTVQGAIMGTLNYMSPEQAEGLPVDARSDIFSFGAVLYEMATGQQAFRGESGIATLSAVLRDEVAPIGVIAPDVPAELDNIITGCLRKNPAERWQTINEIGMALRGVRARVESGALAAAGANVRRSTQASPATNPPPTTTPQTGRRFLPLAATTVAVVAVSIGAAWWESRTTQAPRNSAASQTPAAAAIQPKTARAPIDTPPATPQPDALSSSPATEPAPVPVLAAPTAPVKPVQPITQAKTAAPLIPAAPPATPPPVVSTSAPTPPTSPNPAPAAKPSTSQQTVPVTIGDGVPFSIALVQDLPAGAQVGHAVQFRVLSPVESGGIIVIAKGAIVSGSVASLAGRKKLFEHSKPRFRLMSVEAADGSKIGVRATRTSKSEDDETASFESSKVSKQRGLIAASGSEYMAYVDGDQTVNVRK